MSRRVVITGMGVRAPGAAGVKEFWDLLSAGRTATRRISFFDPSPFQSQVAGECDFDAGAEGLTPREVRRMDRATQFAVVCARDAVSAAGLDLDRVDPGRVGSASAAPSPRRRAWSGSTWCFPTRAGAGRSTSRTCRRTCSTT